GQVWNLIPTPHIDGAWYTNLVSVAAVSPNDVWAVGSYINHGTGPYITLTMHWNGTQWSIVPSPNVGDGFNQLSGVVAFSANDIWAVGHGNEDNRGDATLVMHWDGIQWSIRPSPNSGNGNNRLQAVARTTTNDMW